MANELYDEISKLVEYQTVKFRKILEHEILDIVKSQMNQLEKRIIEVMPKLVRSKDGEMYVELPIDPDYEPEVKEFWDDEQYGEIRNLEKLINELKDDDPVKKGIIERVKRMRREREESEKIKRKIKKKKKKKNKKKRKYSTD